MGSSKRKREKNGGGGIFPIGQQVCKKFNDGWYTGTIISHDIILTDAVDQPGGGCAPLKYLIRYEDEDVEHLSHEEVRKILPTSRTLSLAAARLRKESNENERVDHGMGIAGILALTPPDNYSFQHEEYGESDTEHKSGSASDSNEDYIGTEPMFQTGQEICKEFSTGWYSGNVRNCRYGEDGQIIYMIEYEDGDCEELTQLQVQEYLPTELTLTLAASRRWKEARKQELSIDYYPEKKIRSDL